MKEKKFKNKKAVVFGLGLYPEGSGISAAKFLLKRGARVIVTDLKTAAELRPQLDRLNRSASPAERKRLEFVLGRHRKRDFQTADLVIKNPGVPRESEYLAIAQKSKIPIETDISLFFQLVSRKRIIGITGTRGKSTTASLIYQILAAEDSRTVLAGNISYSPLARLPAIAQGGPVVLELSSWMLESLEFLETSPHLAVITNIYPDHLNRYSGLADYIKAKENIFRWQNFQDFAVVNRDDSRAVKIGRKFPSRRFWFSFKKFSEENGCFVRQGEIIFRFDGQERGIVKVSRLKLPGRHNLANVLAAVSTAMVFGVKPKTVRRVVSDFRGVPDRLEFLGKFKGISYYNDTTATIPEAVIAALDALAGRSRAKKIVLIAGGAAKGLKAEKMIPAISRRCRAAVFLEGSGTKRFFPKLKKKLKKFRLARAGSMDEAVALAREFARPGDIILLSPGFASFGMFQNEFDRGRAFKQVIKK